MRAELRRMEATGIDAGLDLSGIESIPELYGNMIANARADGNDEADAVELLARFNDTTAPEVRDIADTLMQLGYVAAATRLREIAGKRKTDLKPLV
jgi:hypothetical protein